MSDKTTISLTRDTRNRLFQLKREPSETYEDVIRREVPIDD